MIELSNTSNQGLASLWSPTGANISDGWQSPTASLLVDPGDVILMRLCFQATMTPNTPLVFAWSPDTTGPVTEASAAVANICSATQPWSTFPDGFSFSQAQTVVFNSTAEGRQVPATFGIAVSAALGAPTVGTISALAIIVRKIVFGKGASS
jgi:hypothetical protein